jgi:hypothetical protein
VFIPRLPTAEVLVYHLDFAVRESHTVAVRELHLKIQGSLERTGELCLLSRGARLRRVDLSLVANVLPISEPVCNPFVLRRAHRSVFHQSIKVVLVQTNPLTR